MCAVNESKIFYQGGEFDVGVSVKEAKEYILILDRE